MPEWHIIEVDPGLEEQFVFLRDRQMQ